MTAPDDVLPTCARLYYTGVGHRRYKRASTRSGPGEPLCFKSVAEEAIRRARAEERAAHADLSVEVRELVEAAESSGDYLDAYFKASNSSQPADWMDAALLAKQWHCRIAAALAKFTQEKP